VTAIICELIVAYYKPLNVLIEMILDTSFWMLDILFYSTVDFLPMFAVLIQDKATTYFSLICPLSTD